MKHMAGDHHMHSLLAQRFKQRNRLSARHWVKPIQRFIKHQNRGMMGNRLRQTDALPHAFAVTSHSAMRGVHQIYALNRFASQLSCLWLAEPAQQQRLVDKFKSRYAFGKGIKLRAVTNIAKE